MIALRQELEKVQYEQNKMLTEVKSLTSKVLQREKELEHEKTKSAELKSRSNMLIQ